MKKYLIASVVAMMAFAFAAFAASLSVNGGVLQSGVDADLTCAESANVTYDHHVDYFHQAMDAWVEEFYITFDEDCTGNTMYFTVEGQGAVVVDITSNPVAIPVTDGTSWNDGVSVADITGVSVTVWSDANPNNGGHQTGLSGYGWASGIFASLSDAP
jgi:hypothetical protein